MMMHRHIPVEPRHVMAHVHFLHQTSLPQNTKGVIDGVARNPGIPSFHRPVEIIGSWVARSPFN